MAMEILDFRFLIENLLLIYNLKSEIFNLKSKILNYPITNYRNRLGGEVILNSTKPLI